MRTRLVVLPHDKVARQLSSDPSTAYPEWEKPVNISSVLFPCFGDLVFPREIGIYVCPGQIAGNPIMWGV